MTIFKRLNTKQKLSIIIIIPFLGLLFFAFSSLWLKYNSIQSLKKFDKSLKVAKKISRTIYELQKERGYSIIYITSKDISSKAQLFKQRDKVDKQISDLLTFISKCRYLSKSYPNIINIGNLKYFRTNIDNLNFNVKRIAFNYSKIIQKLIYTISKLSLLVQDQKINDKIQSLLYITKYIEFNAIERGIGSAIFVSQYLDNDSYLQLNSYKHNAKFELDNFKNIADKDVLNYYQQTISNDDVIKKYNQLIVYIYNSIYKNEILSNMKDVVGYGGLIHDFKNYLLRGKVKYKIYFNRKYKKLIELIHKYKLYQTTKVEDCYLSMIENTFKEYKNSLVIIDRDRGKKSLTQIDKDIKIDDEDAIFAFKSLYSGLLGIDAKEWFNVTTHRIDKLMMVQNYIFNDLFKSSKIVANKLTKELELFLTILIILIVVVFFLARLVLNEIIYKLSYIQNGIELFLNYISKETQEFKYLEIEGSDEFAKIAEDLNQSIKQTNKHIQQEIKKASENEKRMQENAKMVQMGEMIGNIAHQWRQPLSAIGASASGMKLENSLGTLNKTDIDTYCNNIILKTSYLSKTIDIFRDFIKDNKELQVVNIYKTINEVIQIVSATLKDNYIQLIKEYDEQTPLELKLSPGELSQVIINLINNAKDILIENKIKEPKIIINCQKIDNKVLISIEDNAGGVPQDIISKIFDPYFTTKHKSQGTGLGLHMSRRIVQESLDGDLFVENTQNGAKFSIMLNI